LKASTVYLFPHLYPSPGEFSAVMFTVNGYRDITQCSGEWSSEFVNDNMPATGNY